MLKPELGFKILGAIDANWPVKAFENFSLDLPDGGRDKLPGCFDLV